MCGITGVYDIKKKYTIEKEIILSMADALKHRGPDASACFVNGNIGLGFQRLSIIDLENGNQPFFNDDFSVCMICNGEIYNYKELREELRKKGHKFKTNCDVEVILYLYLEYGETFINRLNGQFAFAIADSRNGIFLMARDHFGICPLFYSIVEDMLVFGSEIKSIIKHPKIKKEVNLTGLDQIFAFPGLVSPTTMFKNIYSLKPGYYLHVKNENISLKNYWDLDYPDVSYIYGDKPEAYYIEQLDELLTQSVKYRLNADVPVAFYLSGGLDSSLIGALMKKINPNVGYQSFSIGFPSASNKQIDERKYQHMVSKHVNSIHNEIAFDWPEIELRLEEAIYHSECPLKETYNTCSLALSKSVHDKNIKVILSGEGADEFFGGYLGYRYDIQRREIPKGNDLADLLEAQLNEKLWGDSNFFYEKNHLEFQETVKAIYSDRLNSIHSEFDCLPRLEINKDKLKGRHTFHKRSYLDLKLRLSDHLISDHCDRVSYANSVEGRYPFLDVNLVNFVRFIPPHINLKNLIEKYILKELSKKYLPLEICDRQKFGFVAPGSPPLIRNNIEWINDMLSYNHIKKQGYFNPDTVERLKKIYTKDGFVLNLPFDSDLLIIVLTFNIFLDIFEMPDL